VPQAASGPNHSLSISCSQARQSPLLASFAHQSPPHERCTGYCLRLASRVGGATVSGGFSRLPSSPVTPAPLRSPTELL
jgi:hypothetical protein